MKLIKSALYYFKILPWIFSFIFSNSKSQKNKLEKVRDQIITSRSKYLKGSDAYIQLTEQIDNYNSLIREVDVTIVDTKKKEK